MVWRARGEGLVAGRRERAEVQERGWGLRDGVCEGGGGRTGDGGTLSGTPRLWLSGRRCPSPRRGRSCGNLQEREPFARVNYLKKETQLFQQAKQKSKRVVLTGSVTLKLFTPWNAAFLPREVTKCSWALRVFMQRLFLKSQILRVLSSAQLTMNLPPGWNNTPRTQLSCPTWG